MVLEKVREIIANQLNVDAATITLETHLVDDLGADSLDIVEMLMTLEEEYGVTLSDEQAGNLKTVKDIVDTISSLKK